MRCRCLILSLGLIAGCGDSDNGDTADDTQSSSATLPMTMTAGTSGETDPSTTMGMTADSSTSGGSDPTTGEATGASESSGEDGSGSTTGSQLPDLDMCLELVENVEFDATPPAGTTKVPGVGDCVLVLDGENLWNYHCKWCHSTLDNNDINDRTMERVIWAVDFSESLENWPAGGLSDYDEAMERILDAIIASPPPVADHPHPLPEYE